MRDRKKYTFLRQCSSKGENGCNSRCIYYDEFRFSVDQGLEIGITEGARPTTYYCQFLEKNVKIEIKKT